MKTRYLSCLLTVLLLVGLTGCGSREEENTASYQQITAEEAKSMMDEQPDAVVLDVREQDEYDAGHIPSAVLLRSEQSTRKLPHPLSQGRIP